MQELWWLLLGAAGLVLLVWFVLFLCEGLTADGPYGGPFGKDW